MIKLIKNGFDIRIDTDDYTYLNDVRNYFTDYVEGFAYMPKYLSGQWSGKICLFKTFTRELPYGLLSDLLRFHKKYYPQLELEIDKEITNMFKGKEINIKYDLNIQPRDYQISCIEAALKYSTGIIKSSVGSGKSAIIAYILKNLLDNNICKKAVIIVPTISLVTQFRQDLQDYGFEECMLGQVYAKIKQFDREIVISTWQTLKNNYDKLELFDAVIIDEVHNLRALEIRTILENCTSASYRLGFTGTLPSSKLDLWNIKAYLGHVLKEYTANDLAERGYISKCNVHALEINYIREYEGEYNDVKDQIFTNPYRLNLIKEISQKVDSSVLILVGKVEKEGELLKTYLENRLKNKEVVFIYGNTSPEDREYWRLECDKRNDIVLIATYPLLYQGVNIPSLKHIILAAPFKSKIRILQSIGRCLRKHTSKINGAYVYDIVDNCLFLKAHSEKRLRFYEQENFNVIEKSYDEIDLDTNNIEELFTAV